MNRVLITGAGGGIGRSLRETLRGVYPVLRVSDRVSLAPARPEDQGREEVIDQLDIADMAAVEKMVAAAELAQVFEWASLRGIPSSLKLCYLADDQWYDDWQYALDG